MYSLSQLIAASSQVTAVIIKIQPGNSLFNMYSGAASWFVNFNYYDYGSGTFITYYSATHNSFTDSACHIEVPMIDVPVQLVIANQDAAARQFDIIWSTAALWTPRDGVC
jgi:hypothetical protein